MSGFQVYALVETLVPGVRKVLNSIGKDVVKENPEQPEELWFDIQTQLSHEQKINGDALSDYMHRIERTSTFHRSKVCADLRNIAIQRAKQEESDVTAVVPDCDAFVEHVLISVILMLSWGQLVTLAGTKSPPRGLEPVVKKAVAHAVSTMTTPRPVDAPPSEPDTGTDDDVDDEYGNNPVKRDSDSDSDKHEKSDTDSDTEKHEKSNTDSDKDKDSGGGGGGGGDEPVARIVYPS